jgi:hypothetical protein
MITLRLKIKMPTGMEREVFAACGAIVRAGLQAQIEATFEALLRHRGGGVPMRLSIDLGTLHPSTWRRDFASSALSALRRHQFKVLRADPSSIDVINEEIDRGQAGASDGAGNTPEVDVAERVDVPLTGLLAFAAFLEKGHFSRLPPWGKRSAANWFSDALDANAGHLVEVALGRAVTESIGYARLQHAVGPILASRAKALCHSGSGLHWVLAHLSGASPAGGAPWGLLSPADWLDTHWRGRSAQSVDTFAAIRADPEKCARLLTLIGPRRAEPFLHRPHDVDATVDIKPGSFADGSGKRSEVTPEGKRLMPPSAAYKRPGRTDVIVVPNAGLICLWPLIPSVLAAIDLRPSVFEKAKVAEAEAEEISLRVSAAIALDYLVWGDPKWQEWRMPINKLLCGLSQDALIDAPTLTDARKTSIDAWLQALPLRLPGMRSCGISDLRQLFLQRPGTLVSENSRWRIEVEPDASDVLLDALPWPLQQAVLPWLTEPIAVIWR